MFAIFRRFPSIRRMCVAIFILPLMFAGGSLVEGLTEQSVGGVDSFDISQYEFSEAYRRIEEQYRRQYGLNNLPENLSRAAAEQAQSQLVSEYLIRAAVNDKNIYASDVAVANQIRTLPDFQDDAGQFSISLFNDYVVDPHAFEKEVREDLQRERLLAVLNNYPITAVRQKMAAYHHQQRIVEKSILTVTTAFNISDDDVSRYYSQNQREYAIREEADWQYIQISTGHFIDAVVPDEETLSLAYQELEDEQEGQEQRTARHIFIEGDDDEAQALANDIFRRAQAAPDTFADLAREFSQDAGSADFGGELGSIIRGDLPPTMDEALFALGIGEISPPTPVDGGFSIIKMESSSIAASEEILPADVEARAKNIIAQGQVFSFIENLQEIAHINVGSLDEVAAAASVNIQTVTAVTQNPDSARTDFFVDEDVLAQLYVREILTDGETSPAIAVNDDDYIFARAIRYQPPSVRPLPEVGADIVKLLNAHEQIAKMRAESTDGDIALPETLSWRGDYTLSFITPEAEDHAEVTQAANYEIFRTDLSGGLPAYALVAEDGAVAIFRIRQIINREPEAENIDIVTQMLDRNQSAAISNAYLRALSEIYNVYFDEVLR